MYGGNARGCSCSGFPRGAQGGGEGGARTDLERPALERVLGLEASVYAGLSRQNQYAPNAVAPAVTAKAPRLAELLLPPPPELAALTEAGAWAAPWRRTPPRSAPERVDIRTRNTMAPQQRKNVPGLFPYDDPPRRENILHFYGFLRSGWENIPGTIRTCMVQIGLTIHFPEVFSNRARFLKSQSGRW